MPVIRFSNGVIDEISTNRGTAYVTVTYREGAENRGTKQTVRLVLGPRTIILGPTGKTASRNDLMPGMIVDGSFSSVMTWSIPPQAEAYTIKIVKRPKQEEITEGTILNVDGRARNITTVSDRDFSTVTRFNVADNTRIFDRFGRPMDFSRLRPGMRVWVRHGNFMTAGIPPRTTAFEIRVL